MPFSTLDTNQSETLEWDEFCILAHHCQTCMSVVDYIPLHEIEGVEFEIHLKATKGGQRPEKAGSDSEGEGSTQEAPRSCLGRLSESVKMLVESTTGVDMNGDGSDNLRLRGRSLGPIRGGWEGLCA